jgi:diamine N-acetyltransferase
VSDTTATFFIRRATPEDASVLAKLAARLFAQAFAAQNTPDDLASFLAATYSSAKQGAELADPAMTTWLAETPSRDLIGFAQVRRGSASESVIAERPVEIARLYSDRAWHGGGVGAALMARCVDAAIQFGADVVWLGVFQQNPRAIAFYEKSGFRKVGAQTFYVGADAQADWVMERRLK